MENKYPKTKGEVIVLKNAVLSDILKNTEPINLEGCFKTKKTDADMLKEIDKEDGDYTSRIVLIIENLLETSEKINIELGMINGSIYYYNGNLWVQIDYQIFSNFLALVAECGGIERITTKKPKFIEKLHNQFELSAYVFGNHMQDDTVKINLQNGTYVINSKYQGLNKPSSQDMFLYQLPFSYNSTADAPMFRKYLDEVLPNKDSQKVLSEYMGYLFIKNLKLEKCIILLGDGANGKSVFYDIIQALLGDENICSYSLSELCDIKGYHRAKLSGKLLNYSSEIGGKNLQMDTVKKLISNEPITCRLPYGNPFELKGYCKLMFNANILPKGIEQTPAFFRRLVPIKFGVTIPVDKRDPFLATKIIGNELSGIFNWVLEGMAW